MIRPSHWLLAGVITGFVYIGVAWTILANDHEIKGAKEAGVGGFEVSISMVAAAVGVEQASVEQQTEQSVKEETIEEIVKQQEAVELTPVLPPTKQDLPKLEKVIENDRPSELVKRVEPKPKTVTKRVAPIEQPKPVKKTAPISSQKILKIVSQGVAKASPTANRADRETKFGGGNFVGNAKPDYITKLRLWLERHKTYPKKAKRRRQQGIVMLAFRMNREGQVLESHVAKSSGIASLDRETLAMLQRAQPLPVFPDDMDGETLKLAVPVQFSLRK